MPTKKPRRVEVIFRSCFRTLAIAYRFGSVIRLGVFRPSIASVFLMNFFYDAFTHVQL